MTKNLLIGVAVFTAIEVVTLGLWFHGATPAVHFSFIGKVALVVGLYAEHFVSVVVGYNIGTGRPWYRFPLPGTGGLSGGTSGRP